MMKKERGIALVSLVITVALMTIIASTVIYVSLDRFEINNLRKMINDIELLQDKVLNYYLKYNGLPILRDNSNVPIQYTYSTLEIQKNSADNEVYYILDLEAMEGIGLNYGKEGFENPNTSKDVYIINEKSHQIYYVEGMPLNGTKRYTIIDNNSLNDTIPPSKPEIKVISGTKNDQGIYTTEVEIEIIPGKDSSVGIKNTTYSIKEENDTEESEEIDINTLNNGNNIYTYTIQDNGKYTITAKSYNNNGNSSQTTLTIEINIFTIAVGQYVEYDVSYIDMYQGTEYTSTNGWRYLGTDDSGNKLLISTAVPVVLYYSYSTAGENAKWWDADTTLNGNVRATNGMLNNFAKIPYTQIASGTSVSTANTAIGRFAGKEVTVNGTTYTAIGDTFKSSTYASKIQNIRTLTLAELNRAVNSANGNTDRAETSTLSGIGRFNGVI